MTLSRRFLALLMAVSAVLSLSACDALKDPEPWTATVEYNEGPTPDKLAVNPLVIPANSAFGEIQVVNYTEREHGFAITDHDAAVFKKIPAGKTRTIGVTELRNNKTYRFYCQMHDEDENGHDFVGRIVVKYLSEDLR